MIDHHGDEWLLANDAADRAGVTPVTVRSWVLRRKVTGHRIGGRLWVRMADVMDAEHATRGRYVAQRRE